MKVKYCRECEGLASDCAGGSHIATWINLVPESQAKAQRPSTLQADHPDHGTIHFTDFVECGAEVEVFDPEQDGMFDGPEGRLLDVCIVQAEGDTFRLRTLTPEERTARNDRIIAKATQTPAPKGKLTDFDRELIEEQTRPTPRWDGTD